MSRKRVYACRFCGYAVQAEGCRVVQCPKDAYAMYELSAAESDRAIKAMKDAEAYASSSRVGKPLGRTSVEDVKAEPDGSLTQPSE